MMNNKALILVKETDTFWAKVLGYNFKDADIELIPETFTPFDRENLAIKINNDYKQVIFYGFYDQFYLLLPLISKKVIRKYIIDIGIGQLCRQYLLANFQQIIEYQDRGLLDYIATTRYDLYIAFKNKMSYVVLDYKTVNEEFRNDSIGILNELYLEESNFYNELSAIALSSIKKAVVLNPNIITKKFGTDFRVEIEEETDIEKIIYKNKINLNCKFCDVSYIYFLMSMDADIPCILGNTNILDDNEKLKEYLVLKSDDDVNEISSKIDYLLKNNQSVMSLYANWRVKYSEKSVKSIKIFSELGAC